LTGTLTLARTRQYSLLSSHVAAQGQQLVMYIQ